MDGMLVENCNHAVLSNTPSSHAAVAGYHSFSEEKLAEAAGTKSNRDNLYPSPLVLPDDELAFDPDYPPQTFQEWVSDEDRNNVVHSRGILYVAAPPVIGQAVGFMSSWTQPTQEGDAALVAQPIAKDIIDYVAAFYTGVPVREFPRISFTGWESSNTRKRSETPRFVGLNTSKEIVRVGTRRSPDGVYPRQLDLTDLLDAAIYMLPDDAYALLLIVHHDLYEDKNDDFCCGRAFGGSRIAIVSTARYQPALDQMQNVERIHAWPASHCQQYIQECCSAKPSRSRKRTKRSEDAAGEADDSHLAPLLAAVTAHKRKSSSTINNPSSLEALFLSRVCRTASHELGHCFGIDHCVYYACVMQGTASVAEDVRQPPYLCPVDAHKMESATGKSTVERYKALLRFCDKRQEHQFFAAFASWIRTVLNERSEPVVPAPAGGASPDQEVQSQVFISMLNSC